MRMKPVPSRVTTTCCQVLGVKTLLLVATALPLPSMRAESTRCFVASVWMARSSPAALLQWKISRQACSLSSFSQKLKAKAPEPKSKSELSGMVMPSSTPSNRTPLPAGLGCSVVGQRVPLHVPG